MQTRTAAWLMSVAGCAACASAQKLPQRYPVSVGGIVAAMNVRGVDTRGVAVSFATPILATVEDPVLEVTTVVPDGDRTAQLLVSCRSRLECPPFYATARWPQAGVHVVASPPIAKPESRGAGNDAQPSANIGAGLRVGARTMLQLEGDRVHVQMRVICLEAGGPGDTIHVRTPDRKQTFAVEVVDSGLTKARL